MNFLIEKGVEPERIRLSQAGTAEPYSEDTESEWHLQNSRVEVFMLGEYVNDPKPSKRVREGQVELPKAPDVHPHAISAPAAEKVH